MKSNEFSESRICPRWQFLLLGCSGPIWTILPNIGKYFRWSIVRFGSHPCENCVPSSSEQNEIDRIFRVTYMSSVTISIAGMQWTDSDHPAEHGKSRPLNVRKVWVQSLPKLSSKQFHAKEIREIFRVTYSSLETISIARIRWCASFDVIAYIPLSIRKVQHIRYGTKEKQFVVNGVGEKFTLVSYS
jgi:hypothetical protein